MLRGLVAFLGEKEQSGWWDCAFLGAIGQRYLSITNPRSHAAAGLMAAHEAARLVHDQRIGKGRVFHLFRFPHAFERRLHRHVLTEDITGLLAAIGTRDKALAALQALAKESDPLADGPLRLGDARSIESPAMVSKLAGIYLGAFRSGKQTMPYFTATE